MATRLSTLKIATLSLLLSGTTFAATSALHPSLGTGEAKRVGLTAPSSAKALEGDPYLLEIDGVSGKALGALETQVIIQHEGRELRFAGEKTAALFRAEPAKYLASIDQKMIAQQLPFYPLETCVVSGEKLGGKMGAAVDIIYKNRLVRFCCKGCKKTFHKNPEKALAKIDKAVLESQTAKYPLATCLVTGEKLGGMGAPIDYIVGNRLVRLCCKGCKKDFAKDPLAYLAKLDSASGAEADRPDAHDGHDHNH